MSVPFRSYYEFRQCALGVFMFFGVTSRLESDRHLTPLQVKVVLIVSPAVFPDCATPRGSLERFVWPICNLTKIDPPLPNAFSRFKTPNTFTPNRRAIECRQSVCQPGFRQLLCK